MDACAAMPNMTQNKLNGMYQKIDQSIPHTPTECNDQPSQQELTTIVVVQPPQELTTVVVVKPMNQPQAKHLSQQKQMKSNNGWRITLIVMWSLPLGIVFLSLFYLIYVLSVMTIDGNSIALFFILVPLAIEITCMSLCLHGANKYVYCNMVFSCVWSVIHMIAALLTMIYWTWYFLGGLLYFGCIFAFSVIFTKKIGTFACTGVCCSARV
eukprot:149830_1